jgi:hypothetical protein
LQLKKALQPIFAIRFRLLVRDASRVGWNRVAFEYPVGVEVGTAIK